MSLKLASFVGAVLVVAGVSLKVDERSWKFNSAKKAPEAFPAPPKNPVPKEELGEVEIPGLPLHLQGFIRLPGDSSRGQRLFAQQLGCADCHATSANQESDAPNLVHVASRLAPRQLVTSVVEPSRDFADGYRSLTVTDVDGVVRTGVVITAASNDQSLVLDLGSNRVSIPRVQIEEISEAQSPMPQGLASDLTPQEFSDLVAYLSSLR